MAEAGQEIESPGGLKLRFLQIVAETDGELLVMEASYSGDGSMPPMHFHPQQAERFEILEGSMRTIVDGEERVYGQGETFEVPAGIPHQMGTDEPTTMRWEVRPAMRTAEFFERLYGDGPDSAREMGESFFAEFDDEFRLTQPAG
jgi:quercetin dioxygenase-like cupin family protein